MKLKLFAVILAAALWPALSQAQGVGVRFTPSPITTTATVAGIPNVYVAVTASTIAFCNAPANSVPCTNKAPTYTDATLSVTCLTTTQVVLDGTTTCVATPDAVGNWGVWAAAGQYSYTVTSSSGASFGPFYVTLGGSGGGGGGSGSGDIIGFYSANSIARIQGNPITITAPAPGQTLTFNPSTLLNAYPGVPVDSSNPATLPCPGATSDRATYLNWTNGTVLTIPSLLGGCGSNLPFVLSNGGGSTLALTPTSPNNIDGGASQAPSNVLKGWAAFVYSDSAGPNLFSIKLPMLAAFQSCPDSAGNHVNFTTAAGFTCGNTSPGGAPGAPDGSIQYRLNSTTFGGFGSWQPASLIFQLPLNTVMQGSVPNGSSYGFLNAIPALPSAFNARGGILLPWGGQLCVQDGACLIGNATGFSFPGITNNTGIQLFNSSTTCTTAPSIGAICTTAAITLPAAYADTNYRLSCIGLGPTNVPIVQTVTKSNTTFTVTIAALTAAAATFTSYDCNAHHN